MKHSFLLTALVIVAPVPALAQDDMYFSVDKTELESKVEDASSDEPTYYCGSNRDVDEYNRRGKLASYYQKVGVDSLGNDIIEFHVGNGSYQDTDTIYPGSGTYYAEDNDFEYSRRLSHFDCWYGWYPYSYGYWSPWRYRWGWYDPWYDGYWGYGYGWYDWTFGWGYPYHHHWWGRPGLAYRGGHTGTLGYYDRNYNRRPSGNTGTNYDRGNIVRRGNRNNAGFGTRRNTTPNYNNSSFNNTNRHSSFGSGSFGGSRGGSFGGGGMRGGSSGGRIGGRR